VAKGLAPYVRAMSGRVLVTGISGFIASHVALALLYAGYTVRGSLRDPGRAGPVAAMLARAGADTGRLEFVRLDLEDDSGWREAARGCRFVQHIASPISTRIPRRREEMIVPAVEGTRRAIAAALETQVERIVMTSSASAVAYGHPPDRTEPYTDADWSRLAGGELDPYSESKTLAELEAWTLMEEVGRRHDFVAVNPTVVLGPLLGDDVGVSPVIIERLLGGVPVIPRMSLNFVDVRDVAALQLAAMVHPRAGGRRYLASAAPVTARELVEGLRGAFPAFSRRLPRVDAPDWAVRLYALVNPEARGVVAAGLGRIRVFDARPAEALLGRPFMTPRLAAAATAQSLIDHGLVRLPPGAAPPEKRG
jgi:nucleoside-diphosphate-sugar epimerase